MALNALPPTLPGVYQKGSGGNPLVPAPLLETNSQQYLWQGQAIVAGTTTSIAVQLSRVKMPYFYPWGAAIEILFSGAPGTFEIDVQFAETDNDNNYASVGVINTVTNNVCRYDMPNTVFPKFVRLFAKTFPNAVTATAIISR